jgi:Leucine-rich repeat (LRR) protein
MQYFDVVPIDIINIIISKLNNDNFENFIISFPEFKNLNYNYITSLKIQLDFTQIIKEFNTIDYDIYIFLLKTFIFIKKINLNINLNINLVDLYNCTKLILHDRKLITLPNEIGNLNYLKVLYLTKNQLKELPKEIGNLINLKELHLNSNKLITIPKEIGNLINLEVLALQSNPLTFLPNEIVNLKSHAFQINIHFVLR